MLTILLPRSVSDDMRSTLLQPLVSSGLLGSKIDQALLVHVRDAVLCEWERLIVAGEARN